MKSESQCRGMACSNTVLDCEKGTVKFAIIVASQGIVHETSVKKPHRRNPQLVHDVFLYHYVLPQDSTLQFPHSSDMITL